AKYYPMESPGTYRLRFTVAGVASNELKIKVLEKDHVEKDGVRFEILAPDRVWPIPENKPEARNPVALGLRITNKTARPLRFCRYDNLFPEMTGPDGKALSIGYVRLRTPQKKEADCPLLKPGESVTFMLAGNLTWHEGKLRLGGSRFGSQWGTRDG